MKKIISVLLALLLLGSTALAACDVKIPASVMQSAIANNDAGAIIRDYLFPMLDEDDSIALLFASELNISNGSPHIRSLTDGGWGERAMFGRLVTAGTVEKNIDGNIRDDMSNAALADLVRAETYRLLFGKRYNDTLKNDGWLKNGNTTFAFKYRMKCSVLDYATGKFVPRKKPTYVIMAKHTTEYSGAKRYAYIECDWKHETNGHYLATFGIVR